MNAEDAKVPNVESDWQSIEIFLFSNGQQYSPPRKYHLRADELNLWEVILSRLAQSHYGIQTPLINLYTTDGQVVEGPLQLKDGEAYVAVAPSDTFVEAGYKKYLLRASRSWEKRQARKKIAEGFPVELPCCCPEKDWSCNLQTCCLCPEKEDSLEPLAPATGHPELRPAGGHFMSTAPAKPIAANRSGKIGSTTGEDEVRQGPHGTIPGEFEYSSVLAPVKLKEYGKNPDEHTHILNENRAKPDDYGAKLDKNSAEPGKDGENLSENAAILKEIRAKPVENRGSLSKNGASLGEYENRPNGNGAKPSEYVARPSANGAKLGENGAIRGEYETNVNGTKVCDCGASPGKYVTRPHANGAKRGEHGDRPVEYETSPSENKPKQGEYRVIPSEYETRPNVNGTKNDEYEAIPYVNQAILDECGARLGEYEAGQSENETVPTKYGARSCVYETKLTENGGQSNDQETRSSVNGARLNEHRARAAGNGVGKYTNKSAEQKSKIDGYKFNKHTTPEIEYKRRLSAQGGDKENAGIPSEQNRREIDHNRKPCCHEIEHTQRQRDTKTDHANKTSEKVKEFEHGGSVREQKGSKTNSVGKTSGQRTGESGPKLNEQKCKRSDHLAKLSFNDKRVSDQTDSRVTESGAKTTPMSKVSPRDRMTTRGRTSNLSQPKFGAPGTTIDETTINDRMGDPEARQGNVTRSGATGASHIVEVQQNTRRSSAPVGKQLTEKKRLSVGQNSSLLRKSTPISSALRTSKDKQPIQTNKEILPTKLTGKPNALPIPASSDSAKLRTMLSNKCMNPPVLSPPAISVTNQESPTTVVLTRSFKDPESEIRSMMFDSVKYVIDSIKCSPEETQTEQIYVEKTMASVSVNKEIQTNTEAVEERGQEMSTSKTKVDMCTCTHFNHRDYRIAAVDSDENIISILSKGDVINLKLDIEVRKTVRSVYSCPKNCRRSRSLANVTRSEKESQISIDNEMFVQRNSLQSLLSNQQNFSGYGFENSPKVMVVQCAGCGRLNNPPRCDPTPCCDNNKKYFVLLTNSLHEDTDDSCYCNPLCRPYDQRQLRKQFSGVPIKTNLSEMTLDTVTTVTVSGVAVPRREIGKCVANTVCQTGEPQLECMMTKRKVSITKEFATKSEFQKESMSPICVAMPANNPMPKHSCLKICTSKRIPEDCKLCRPVTLCQKVQSECSQVNSQTCIQVQSKERQQTCPQVQLQPCTPVSPPCPPCDPPVPCIQTQVCPLVPLVSKELCPSVPLCQKVQSACSHANSQTCTQVQSKGCQQTCPQVQLQPCTPVSPPCPPCDPPVPCIQTQVCPLMPLVSKELCPSVPLCQKVQSACSHANSQTCTQVQSKGCQQTCPQVQLQPCMPVSPPCPPCDPPVPCIQTQVCPQVPPVSDGHSQTHWASLVLQAHRHCDGRYSFHLPPLHVLNNYSFL